MKARRIGAIAFACAAVAISACGSSTSDSPGSGGSAGGGGTAGADGGSACPALAEFPTLAGKPCPEDGRSCGTFNCAACAPCNGLKCTSGKWQWSYQSGCYTPDAADGGAKLCGGKQGLTCANDEYCDFANSCGAGGALGACKKRPQGCGADCPGVCGCDGKFYCNACGAAGQGVDVTGDSSCMKDGGGPGTTCTSSSECNTGLKCCYPCGQAGCSNQCMQPMPNGQCPAFP